MSMCIYVRADEGVKYSNSYFFVQTGPKHFYIFISLKRMWKMLYVIYKSVKTELYRVLLEEMARLRNSFRP